MRVATMLAVSVGLLSGCAGSSPRGAARGFFGLTTPDGHGPVEHAKRFGFPPPEALEDGPRLGVSENLFRSGLYDQKGVKYVARRAVENWLESPLHRRVLLSPLFEQQGLGVALIGRQVYVTQDLF